VIKNKNNYPYNHETSRKPNTKLKKQLHNALVENIFSDFAEIASFNTWKNMYTSKLELQKRVYGSHQNSAFLFRLKARETGNY